MAKPYRINYSTPRQKSIKKALKMPYEQFKKYCIKNEILNYEIEDHVKGKLK